jgi:arylsulfatase A-like enzyme
MKKNLFIGALTLTAAPIFAQQAVQRPNIIFIMSDDHASQAISAYGHPLSKLAPTPNIDRIAKNGAQFWNNYCANSLSGPSRASILTGKHSHKNGYLANWNKEFATNIT